MSFTFLSSQAQSRFLLHIKMEISSGTNAANIFGYQDAYKGEVGGGTLCTFYKLVFKQVIAH